MRSWSWRCSSALQSLRVIATSRQPLGVPGEQVWRVRGLAVAGPADAATTASPKSAGRRRGGAVHRARREGFELVRSRRARRARQRAPDLPHGSTECRWRSSSRRRASRSCRSARSPSGSSATRASCATPRGPLPSVTARCDAMLEWSHRMLEPDEQRLFRRLSVFRGSFSLAAAESVCAGYQLDVAEVLDLLAVLIDRSLVQVVDDPEEARYRLMGTVRQYAAAKLWDGPEGPTRSRPSRPVFPRRLPWRSRAGLAGPEQSQLARAARARARQPRSGPRVALRGSARRRRAARLACCGRSGTSAGTTTRPARGSSSLLTEPRRSRPRAARRRPGQRRRGRVPAVRLRRWRSSICSARSSWSTSSATGAPPPTALQRLGSIAREQARYDEARELHERSLAMWRGARRRGRRRRLARLPRVRRLAVAATRDGRGACARAALAAFERAGNLQAPARPLDQPRCLRAVPGRAGGSPRERLEQALSQCPRARLPGGHRVVPARARDRHAPRAPADRRVRADASRGAARPPPARRPVASWPACSRRSRAPSSSDTIRRWRPRCWPRRTSCASSWAPRSRRRKPPIATSPSSSWPAS